MIEILLKDVLFEQDIRELLMAFYPGEEFIHESGAKAFLTFWAEHLEITIEPFFTLEMEAKESLHLGSTQSGLTQRMN